VSFIGRTIGKLTGAQDQADAAKDAAATQAASAQAGIDEQHRQFDALQKLMSPFVNAGMGSLGAQQNLLGLNGNDAQQTAINGIKNSSQFQALQQQGNDAILANASATGGLRGGNVQAALSQFSPALLASLIQQQYSNLGGLTSLGQNAAAGVGNAGMQTGSNVANLLQQQGAATAGGQIAQGGVARQGFSDGLNIAGTIMGMSGGFGGFGGGGSGTSSLFSSSTPASIANYAPATSMEVPSLPFLSKF